MAKEEAMISDYILKKVFDDSPPSGCSLQPTTFPQATLVSASPSLSTTVSFFCLLKSPPRPPSSLCVVTAPSLNTSKPSQPGISGFVTSRSDRHSFSRLPLDSRPSWSLNVDSLLPSASPASRNQRRQCHCSRHYFVSPSSLLLDFSICLLQPDYNMDPTSNTCNSYSSQLFDSF